MPIVRVQVPHGVFDEPATEELITALTEATADVEQIPPDPDYRIGLVILWEVLPAGSIRSNGTDPTALVAPVFVWVHPPAGVIDDERAATYVARVQQLFTEACVEGGPMVTTSVVIAEVADGRWGIGGEINRLADFAHRAGYRHLQHLVDV